MGGIVPATNHASAALMPYIRACMFLGMSPVATQAERSARSRSALLESAARGISRHGYGKLVLKDVAREAGYTRGALYHQFKDKEDLALAVLDWVGQNWIGEVGDPARAEPT